MIEGGSNSPILLIFPLPSTSCQSVSSPYSSSTQAISILTPVPSSRNLPTFVLFAPTLLLNPKVLSFVIFTQSPILCPIGYTSNALISFPLKTIPQIGPVSNVPPYHLILILPPPAPPLLPKLLPLPHPLLTFQAFQTLPPFSNSIVTALFLPTMKFPAFSTKIKFL